MDELEEADSTGPLQTDLENKVAHTWNPSHREAEAGGSLSQGQREKNRWTDLKVTT